MDELIFDVSGCVVNASTGEIFGTKGRRIGSDCFGYENVRVGGKTVRSHRLIWECVHGPIPDDLQINHINGDKRDNRIENLELVTPSENIKHAFATGLHSTAGERHPGAKLSEDDVREIRASSGRSSDLAKRYGVTRCTVNQVRRRQTWRHVP